MGQADELQERLISFAAQMIKLSALLPKTFAGRHIAGQILRSGTSPAPNYGEARGAESHADFIHKLGIVLKELNETAIWLEIIKRSGIANNELFEKALDECHQLAKIINASLQTARSRVKR